MLLQGVFVPLTCPFYRDGASYLRKLEHNVARYSLSPVAGMIALPPGGEAATLTDAEAHASLESVAAAAGESKVLVAGVERAGVPAALELARVADRHRFDAILLAPPPDWSRLAHGGDARELLMFYLGVADRSPLPVVLFSDPRPPFLELPVSLLGSLATHPNVLGLLDTAPSVERVAAMAQTTASVRRDVTVTPVFEAVTRRMLAVPVPGPAAPSGLVVIGGTAPAATGAETTVLPALKIRTRNVAFQLIAGGAAHSLLPLLEAGVAAAAPDFAACAPQACFEAYAAWKDGDPALAAERGGRLRDAEEIVAQLGPAALKAGCDLNGYFGGQPRLPRLPLTAAAREQVQASLAAIRN